ncbi:hypothetical protein ACHAXS_006501 [Conticribra weissflogii]
MKILLHILTLLASADAYALYPRKSSILSLQPRRSQSSPLSRLSTALNYKDIADDDGHGQANVWSVLANTERWISDTLDKSNQAAKIKNEGMNSQQSASISSTDNPYARKEVSYVCETGDDLAVVVGGIFRRIREAREKGENHGKSVEQQIASAGDGSYTPTTMRQTNVVVIPNCEELSSSFRVFDELVQAINQARRRARDFVIKKDDSRDSSNDWVVSINCAHLHPQYGVQTPEERLAAMKHEDEEGEVDINLQEYKQRRDEARRSPYPSIIVEVQSTPPPDFGSRSSARPKPPSPATRPPFFAEASDGEKDPTVTSDDVKRLEALFGMSAATKSSDDMFYDALGEAFGDKQISTTTPLEMAQNWVLENDPAFDVNTSTFTNSDTRHVDAAYEFVFNNFAMLRSQKDALPKRGQKSYIVLPNFLPTSATSFDRFAGQVSNIIRSIPGLTQKVTVSTFHPEHIEKRTRSPVPIFVATWK